jgi:hypothetical protein
MRKIYILGVALFALFAFGGVLASGASAETVWLVSNALTALKEPAVVEEGLLKINVLNSLLGLVVEYECSGEFDGTIGPDGEDEITKVLDLNLKEIGALGALGTGLDCTVLSAPVICTNAAKLLELWPDNLPWGTLIELMAVGEEEFLDVIGLVNGNEKELGFDFECENSGGTFTEGLCEGQLTAVLTNLASDVLGVFLEQDRGCTEAGTVEHWTGEGLIVLASGLSLQVSEG